MQSIVAYDVSDTQDVFCFCRSFNVNDLVHLALFDLNGSLTLMDRQ